MPPLLTNLNMRERMVCLHCYTGGHNKFYNIWLEADSVGGLTTFHVKFCYGAAANPSGLTGSKGSSCRPEAVRNILAKLIHEKERKGYKNVLHLDYGGGLSFEFLCRKATPSSTPVEFLNPQPTSSHRAQEFVSRDPDTPAEPTKKVKGKRYVMGVDLAQGRDQEVRHTITRSGRSLE